MARGAAQAWPRSPAGHRPRKHHTPHARTGHGRTHAHAPDPTEEAPPRHGALRLRRPAPPDRHCRRPLPAAADAGRRLAVLVRACGRAPQRCFSGRGCPCPAPPRRPAALRRPAPPRRPLPAAADAGRRLAVLVRPCPAALLLGPRLPGLPLPRTATSPCRPPSPSSAPTPRRPAGRRLAVPVRVRPCPSAPLLRPPGSVKPPLLHRDSRVRVLASLP